MPEHRVQVQGLSEDDYDKVYRTGYQDGLDQAKYVSDYQVGEIILSADYDSNQITVTFEKGYDVFLVTKTAMKNMFMTMQTGEYKYIFEED